MIAVVPAELDVLDEDELLWLEEDFSTELELLVDFVFSEAQAVSMLALRKSPRAVSIILSFLMLLF
ncbi:hypothetical protein OfM2_06710 [Lactovum odontotermitis]